MSIQIVTARSIAVMLAAGWTGAAIVGVLNPASAHADSARVGPVRIEADGGQVRSSTQSDWTAGPMVGAYPARQGSDPGVTIGAQGTIRAADMADAHRPSVIAAPQAPHAAGAVQNCYRGETVGGIFNVGSERCQDAGQ